MVLRSAERVAYGQHDARTSAGVVSVGLHRLDRRFVVLRFHSGVPLPVTLVLRSINSALRGGG
jgi:hypothetical protein